MPTSRRQTLFDAVVTRFRGITTAGGYDTNLGKQVHPWRDTKKDPFNAEELATGALNVRDPRNRTEQGGPAVIGKHHHTLTIVLEGAVNDDGGATVVRQFIADCIKAIGVDRKWGGVAYDTTPGEDEILVAENGLTVTGFTLTFEIQFRTGNYDPFNA